MSGPAALSSALTGDVGVTPRVAARARAPTARRGARSPSPVAWTRRRSGDDDARVAASPGAGAGATVRVAPARALSSSRRPGSLLVARAAPSDDDDTLFGGQTEVMRSVAERVKAARELAKRLASKEEGLNAPGPRRESAEGGGAVDVRPRADDPDGSYDKDDDDASRDDPDGSYDEADAAAAESDLAGDYHGGDDAAAAAAAAAAKLAEMEAAAAKAEEAAFAARAVSQMDEAVTRIRQEAAKRVAAAERERDRAKEEAKTSAEEAVRRATALEETLRQVKADADARVEAAENAQLEWEILAETARVAKEQAEEQAATKVRVAEEAARVGIGEADDKAEEERKRAEEAVRKAEQDVEAAKMVQETITRQEKEKAEAAVAEAERNAAEKIAAAEARLAEAVEAARLADAGAKSEAEEILKEELARTEEALNAAEEIAAIEVAAAEEAAAVLVAEMEEKMAAAVAAAEAKATKAIDKAQADALRRVNAANEKAELMIAEAKAEAEEAAKTAEAIAAAKDAVAAAVESAEADVLSARTAASDAEAEVKKIREAADAQIAELSEDFQAQIEEARREAAEKAEADVAAANARAEEAESKIDAAVAAAEAKAEASIAAADEAASEKITAAKKQRDEAVAAAKADAAAQVEAARTDAAEKIDAAREKTKAAREEAKAAAAEAKRAAEWEVEAAKANAEAEAAAAREAEAVAAKLAAEEAKQEALNKLIETELEAQRARDETAAERANVEAEIAKRDAAVAEAVAAANEVSARELDRIRQEGAQPAVDARAAQAAAEEEARTARAEAEYEKAQAQAAAAEAAAALDAVRLERDLAEERAAEAERVRADLIAGDQMEREIEFEKRVAAATAEAEAETARERARADVAESDLSDAKQKIESLRAELDTASAELVLMSNEETREGISKERITTEIARLTVALEARDAEIATLRANLESVAAGKGLTVDFQNPVGGGDAAPAAAPAAAPEATEPPKSAEEAELEALLNEVMLLKGENASLEAARGAGGSGEMAAVEAVQTMESVYAEAYHAALAARKAARRKEAEAWAATQVAVVASSIPEVYHWLGGGPRHGDSAIVYNRRNPNGLGDGGQCFMHLGYNGWQGDPRQVGMRPLQHDHPARAEYWLNDKGGDWWIAEPVYVHPEASILDFVFSDGEGDYDNFGGKDYHSPVGAENGDPVDDVDHVGERERQLEAEQGHLDPAFAERAGRRAERQFLSRRGFDPKIEEDVATKKVVTMPRQLVAGQEIEIFYRHHEDPDPNAPLRGASDVFVQGGFNRWTHGENFGPLRMEPAQNPPGDERAQPALVARVRVPQDAHVVDFVFTDDARSMHGRYDSKGGLDYHASTVGAVGSAMPCLRVVHVAVEMAPIAKVGGMGDVVTALSRAVIEKGHSVEVILPKYDCMDHEQIDDLNLVDQMLVDGIKVSVWKGEVEEVPVTFLQPDNGHFDVGCIYGRGDDHIRFEFFSKCALEYMTHAGDVPDIVHAHDWSTSHCVFARKSQLPPGAATCLTIHNLQFGQDLIGQAMRACTFATTVSPTYAEEIKEQGAVSANKGKMVGIRNGIDVSIWNPMTDEFLTQNYDMDSWQAGKAAARQQLAERLGMNLASAETPLVAVVSRLTHQKGIHLIKHACYRTLERGGQFVLLGSSPDGNVQNDFNSMAYDVGGRFPGQSGFVFAYDEPLSHLVYAAADMLLVPSMFEPCGLTQMIAMRYGTVPVVRRTGGLRDTVFDVDEDSLRAQSEGLKVNGFSFDGSHDHDIEYALDRAMMMYSSDPPRWQELVNGIMRQDWGWTDPAEAYVEQYWKAAKSMKDAYFIEQSQTRR